MGKIAKIAPDPFLEILGFAPTLRRRLRREIAGVILAFGGFAFCVACLLIESMLKPPATDSVGLAALICLPVAVIGLVLLGSANYTLEQAEMLKSLNYFLRFSRRTAEEIEAMEREDINLFAQELLVNHIRKTNGPKIALKQHRPTVGFLLRRNKLNTIVEDMDRSVEEVHQHLLHLGLVNKNLALYRKLGEAQGELNLLG